MKTARIITFAIMGGLAACSSGPQLVDYWNMETNTNSHACGFVLRSDKSFSQNCNGYNVQRGTWVLDGQSIRFVHETGGTTVCAEAFDGSVLVLSGGQCLFPGRYQRQADFDRDHPIK